MTTNYEREEVLSLPARVLFGLLTLTLASLFGVASYFLIRGCFKVDLGLSELPADLSLFEIHALALVALLIFYIFSSTAYSVLLKPNRSIFSPYALLFLLALLCLGMFASIVLMVLGMLGQVSIHAHPGGLKGIIVVFTALGIFGSALFQQYKKVRLTSRSRGDAA